ncbi:MULTISPECIES: aldehyde dehydrogenase family protein [unclassified Amycolatopsis]|uniref:aldehyde dehydrogenase family protein n=1 Tax=unclassified Amycolatopsis TaxID=2618356 RepID=UPI00287B5CD3|nr:MULTISPECIES: aldehyde dehydrogenase family protein [unclassified Amycolatopsis]
MTAVEERPGTRPDVASGRLFIGGRWAETADRFDAVAPATGKTLTTLARATAADVDTAVAAARQAFGGWAATPGRERARVLHRVADLVRARADEIAALESADVGKPISLCRAVDVETVAEQYEYYSALAQGVDGATRQIPIPSHAYPRREPLGVVAAITSFNFPLILSTAKIAPAPAAGNTGVHKPAEDTSLSALLMAELLAEAGVPEGVLNVVTGSTAVGRHAASVAGAHLKPVTLELGGNTAGSRRPPAAGRARLRCPTGRRRRGPARRTARPSPGAARAGSRVIREEIFGPVLTVGVTAFGREYGPESLDALRPDEVRVRIVATGVCHTDLGVAAGALPFPLPGVLGHEGAGIAEETGATVTRVQPGDRVLLSYTSCGGCPNCRDGTPIGGHSFGQSSFAGHAVADERSVVKVAADAPLDLLAPLGCGIMTGAGAVWNVLAPRPGATLLVTGAGAVGLSAVMAAHLTPATRIIAVDRVPGRLELARELGATDTIDTSGEDLAETVGELTGGRGVDGVVETTGNAGLLGTAIGTLAPRGTAVVVGAPAFGTQVPVDVNFLLPGRHVGLTMGDADTQALVPTLAELVAAGRFPLGKLVTHYEFGQIQRAVDDMLAGTTIKPVLRW